MERNYTDVGFISKGAMLMAQDTDGKYKMLIPVVDMPETKSAPATVEKTVLSDGSVTETQGLQSNSQKTYTFNYHRDNLRALNKFANKQVRFLEVNPDHTGERFVGTLVYGRSAMSVNGIVQGQIFITVNEADDLPLDDVRDITKKTAIITTPLNEVVLKAEEKYEVNVETLPANATVTATSSASTIATATVASGKLTITGVAKGNAIVELKTTAEGEAESYRTIAVIVDSKQ
jgi:hypothetical protein